MILGRRFFFFLLLWIGHYSEPKVKAVFDNLWPLGKNSFPCLPCRIRVEEKTDVNFVFGPKNYNFFFNCHFCFKLILRMSSLLMQLVSLLIETLVTLVCFLKFMCHVTMCMNNIFERICLLVRNILDLTCRMKFKKLEYFTLLRWVLYYWSRLCRH